MNTHQELYIKLAHEAGIEIRIAKKRDDATALGLHLVEPNLDQLVEGIKTALLMGADVIILHSKIGWPYPLK
jgi:pyruvate/2-oxoglutarate dehydrogenase complex dihydrolipoamide dehydrogenase (E3) component